jgi:hypothetical protein
MFTCLIIAWLDGISCIAALLVMVFRIQLVFAGAGSIRIGVVLFL